MKWIKFILSLAPSDNRRFIIARHYKGFILSKEHRKYKNKIVPREMLPQRKKIKLQVPTYKNQMFVKYQVFLKDKRRDGSNVEKVLKDSLTGILWKDDKWVNLQAMEVIVDKTNPRIEIWILGD